MSARGCLAETREREHKGAKTMTTATLTNPLKWHGGKADLADWIISLMPPRCRKPNAPEQGDAGWLHYVEPFFGGGSVLLAQDPEGISEVVNDLNAHLVNFWSVLKNDYAFGVFQKRIDVQAFCEVDWKTSKGLVDSLLWNGVNPTSWTDANVLRAVAFFIACRQSLSGRMKGFAGITRNRTRRGMNEQVSAWLNAIEGLPAVHARLKRVLIRNQPALDIIRKEDGPRTLFYLDPPYLHETRATTGEYEHEMSHADHEMLLGCLSNNKGRFLLSGYHSTLYDEYAADMGWKCHEKAIHNHAAGGKTKKVMTECVWTNF